MTITVFGIPNCDTVKRARAWLAAQGVEYNFHDYKKQGIEKANIEGWIETAGVDKVLNRAGTTFRKLPDEVKHDLTPQSAAALMAEHPSAIKRPIVEHPAGLLVGFNPEDWASALG